MNTHTFHLSLVVPDLRKAVEFYRLLGVELTEDHNSWVGLDFFGHQLVLHQQTRTLPAVAIDHFGCFLSKSHWLELARKLRDNDIAFALPPQLRQENQPDESGKFVVQDPAENRIELKYRSSNEST
ncbi:MAG: dioxygenase [Lysobacteraceae bacterium]|nr:MAG: dioxygenase [Xanthomonadaceae bacterium]